MNEKPARLLRHPVILAGLVLWLVNDHVLKGRGPGWLTGKLSDVACLIVVPALFVAVVELWQSRKGRSFVPRRGLLLAAIVATGLVMATINTLDAAAFAYRNGLGVLQWPLRQLVALPQGELAPFRPVRLWMDPTDLWTLPSLVVPWLVSRQLDRADSAVMTSPRVLRRVPGPWQFAPAAVRADRHHPRAQ